MPSMGSPFGVSDQAAIQGMPEPGYMPWLRLLATPEVGRGFAGEAGLMGGLLQQARQKKLVGAYQAGLAELPSPEGAGPQETQAYQIGQRRARMNEATLTGKLLSQEKEAYEVYQQPMKTVLDLLKAGQYDAAENFANNTQVPGTNQTVGQHFFPGGIPRTTTAAQKREFDMQMSKDRFTFEQDEFDWRRKHDAFQERMRAWDIRIRAAGQDETKLRNIITDINNKFKVMISQADSDIKAADAYVKNPPAGASEDDKNKHREKANALRLMRQGYTDAWIATVGEVKQGAAGKPQPQGVPYRLPEDTRDVAVPSTTEAARRAGMVHPKGEKTATPGITPTPGLGQILPELGGGTPGPY